MPTLPPAPPPHRHRLGILIAVSVVVFLAAGMAAAPGLSDFERSIFDTFHALPEPLATVLLVLMPLGSGLAAVALPLVLVPFAGLRWTAMAWLSTTGSWLVANGAKGLAIRGRPLDVLDEFLPLREATGAGYPSGHTAVAVGLAAILWPRTPPALRPVLVLAAAGVAVSRLHVGVHLPLDLVGGTAIGLAVAALVRLGLSRRAEPSESPQ